MEAAQAHLSLHLSKCQIIRNHVTAHLSIAWQTSGNNVNKAMFIFHYSSQIDQTVAEYASSNEKLTMCMPYDIAFLHFF